MYNLNIESIISASVVRGASPASQPICSNGNNMCLTFDPNVGVVTPNSALNQSQPEGLNDGQLISNVTESIFKLITLKDKYLEEFKEGKIVRTLIPVANHPVRTIIMSLLMVIVPYRSKSEYSETDYARLITSMRETANRINSFVDQEDSEQVYVKYWLDYLMWKFMKEDPYPPQGLDSHKKLKLFSGFASNLVSRQFVKPRGGIFFYSLQKGAKKCWPTLGLFKLQEAYEKHASCFRELHGVIPDDLRYNIQKVSNEVFGMSKSERRCRDKCPYSEPTLTKLAPGNAAANGISRTVGGKSAAFSAFNPKLIDADSNVKVNTKELTSDDERDRKILGELRYLDMKYSSYRKDVAMEARDYAMGEITGDCSKRISRMIGEESDDNRKDESSANSLKTKEYNVLAVAEPSKFRILGTTSVSQVHLGPAQGFCLSQWKQDSSSTMLSDDLTGRVQEIVDSFPELLDDKSGWGFYSIDYSAATDKILRDAVREASIGLSRTSYYSAILHEFTPMKFKYPKGMLKNGRVVEAVDGFPMGHALSFAFLCVVNKAVLYTCVERAMVLGLLSYEQMLRIMDKNLINGDDMMAVMPKSVYELFNKTAKDAGFQISVGKHFFSKKKAMINSQLFQLEGKKVIRLYYINTQIITGMSSKKGESQATPVQVEQDINDMLEHIPKSRGLVPMIFSRFSGKRWQGNFVPNWYLPIHLGGFGVKPEYAPPSWRITANQLVMCSRFVTGMSDGRPLALYRSTPKMSLSLAKFAQSMLRIELVKKSDLAQRMLDLNRSNDKLGSLSDQVGLLGKGGVVDERMQMFQAMVNDTHVGLHPTTDIIARAELVEQRTAKSFKTDYRLMPMSADVLIEYFVPYFIANVKAGAAPSCSVNSFNSDDVHLFIIEPELDLWSMDVRPEVFVYQFNPFNKLGILELIYELIQEFELAKSEILTERSGLSVNSTYIKSVLRSSIADFLTDKRLIIELLKRLIQRRFVARRIGKMKDPNGEFNLANLIQNNVGYELLNLPNKKVVSFFRPQDALIFYNQRKTRNLV